jgi:hypothetical protein
MRKKLGLYPNQASWISVARLYSDSTFEWPHHVKPIATNLSAKIVQAHGGV